MSFKSGGMLGDLAIIRLGSAGKEVRSNQTNLVFPS
jgi:hypothetical protein